MINARAIPALEGATGEHLGADHDAWLSWWADRLGYRYERPKSKPTITANVSSPYRPHYVSCFAAGTLVIPGTAPGRSNRSGSATWF